MKIALKLIHTFKELCNTTWEPSEKLVQELINYIDQFKDTEFNKKTDLKNKLIFIINNILDLNKKQYRKFINSAAKKGILLNYHEKLEIEEAISSPEINFKNFIEKKSFFIKDLSFTIEEIEKERNKKLFSLDSYLEKEKNKDIIIESIFCSFIYYSVQEEIVHKKNNSDCMIDYKDSFFNHLTTHHREQINRKNGLAIVNVEKIISTANSYNEQINILMNLTNHIYENLDNHSYLAFILNDNIEKKWQFISDITIYTEKFIEEKIDKVFFKSNEIRKNTEEYIKNINKQKVNFHMANTGFQYKDCYLAYNQSEETCLLLFEKNKRDERIIPCPKCRSNKVQGNSYPILGVRSWECKNTFCGEKSKSNRGKRYSLLSIIRQQAILDDRNLIKLDLLKKWRKDIVTISSDNEIFEFLINCYSLYGDTVNYYNQEQKNKNYNGRLIKNISLKNIETCENTYNNFLNMDFFKRFLVKKDKAKTTLINLSKISGLSLYNGNSFDVLCNFQENTISGAVTSPPYYNARDYSQWENIYCYLYDIYNISLEVYRTLENGAPYLFNIFDYFDNENTIVFSAMGKKRIILSAYIAYIFRDIGFNYLGNCAWDKGEIQGNRNFNQGNFSPYYQAPHNCWEHIMIFSKGTPTFDKTLLPKRILQKPVFKMIKGENTYGHSAPYPKHIPELLLKLLKNKKNATILDPFSGSMTTGRTAYENGVNSINIELKKEYCQLSLDLLKINSK